MSLDDSSTHLSLQQRFQPFHHKTEGTRTEPNLKQHSTMADEEFYKFLARDSYQSNHGQAPYTMVAPPE